jgi:hypothetical protein
MKHLPNLVIAMGLGVSLLAVSASELALATPQTSSPSMAETDAAGLSEPNSITPNLSGSVDAEIEKVALKLFSYQDGEWDSVWEMFDAAGSPTSIMTGTVVYSSLLGNHTQKVTHLVPKLDHKSSGIRGFNPIENKIVTFNMADNGVYWKMHQDPLTGVTLSDPHRTADGTVILQRYTRHSSLEDSYKVVMEESLNSGKTWFKRYDQTLTRKGK